MNNKAKGDSIIQQKAIHQHIGACFKIIIA